MLSSFQTVPRKGWCSRHAARVLAALRAEVARILKLPDVADRFTAQGAIVPEPMTQTQVAAFLGGDVSEWRRLIREANIQAD